jgi:peptidyl-prolyl cis-trans isomerase B (cyclophilin B)
VNSFVSLARQGFFDGTQCHRLTTFPNLSVLQCGAARKDGSGGPGYRFDDEYPTNQYGSGDPALTQQVQYPRGTVAMATSGPDTNGSQFMLFYQDSEMPPQYTVFGKIDETGLATIAKVAKGGVAGGQEDGPPAIPVTIQSVRVD